MKIIFSAIKNAGIFEDDFMHLPEGKGTIEFKRMQTAGGIAVIYAPNGTGKTSFANLLSTEVSNENIFFDAVDERGNRIAPESGVFHVIQDQINRNVIRGETTDYLIGAQIRREYDLRNQINIFIKMHMMILRQNTNQSLRYQKLKIICYIRYPFFSIRQHMNIFVVL